jgi:hypothetical protein
MAYVEAYLYGSGAATGTVSALNTYHTIGINEGGGIVRCRINSSGLWSSALTTLETNINASTLAGTYTITQSAGVVTIAGTVAHTLHLYGSAGPMLGYALSTYGSALSHTADRRPAGRIELQAYECQILVNADRAELRQYRHGRAMGLGFGNVDLYRTSVYITSGDYQAALAEGYALTGRIRIVGDGVGAYAADNLDGYVDGFVVSTPELETYGDGERFARISLVVAVPR